MAVANIGPVSEPTLYLVFRKFRVCFLMLSTLHFSFLKLVKKFDFHYHDQNVNDQLYSMDV